MVPIERLDLVKALHLVQTTKKIAENPNSDLLEFRQQLEDYKLDLSKWPFTDLSEMGVTPPENQGLQARSVSEFEREHVFMEGCKKALAESDTESILIALIESHPDTVYGPPMSVVRDGVAKQMNIPQGMSSRFNRGSNDANRDVPAQGPNVPSGRTVQLDTSDNSP